MRFNCILSIFKRNRPLLRHFKPSYVPMSTGKETEWTEESWLFGIEVDRGPIYFASSAVKSKLELQNNDSVSSREFVNAGVLYNVSNTSEPLQDLVKSRITHSLLKKQLTTLSSCESIWSSFQLCTQKQIFRSGFTVKFEQHILENVKQYTQNVINVAKSFGWSSISKLVPHNQGFLVDVISCETNDRVDHFEMFPTEYPGYHPLFNHRHSVFKSLEETQSVFDMANKHTPLPEIQKLRNLAKTSMNNPRETRERPHPFIVVEGFDAVGKSTLVGNLGKRIGAQILHTPPLCLSSYRALCVKQTQPVCRAFYSLGNYLIVEDIKEAIMKCPVVLDRFWHSSAAYAIAHEAKCGGESNIPPKGHPIYQWPRDLLKPSAVIVLVLDEEERQVRMRNRGYPETSEETMLKKSQLFRERLLAAYKNMDDPACIIIDASKSKEEVCDDVVMSLRRNKVLT